jgi:PAS domain-containing protein
VAAHENLTRAFLTFTQAAGSLEKSYTQLQAEVARLHLELQRTNSELERTLEENARVRGYLSRVVENLPCGVLVVSAKGALQIINPEARRLLEVPADWVPRTLNGLPPTFEAAIAEIPANSFLCEQETLVSGASGNRAIGILRRTRFAIRSGAWSCSPDCLPTRPRTCRKRGSGSPTCRLGCEGCRQPPSISCNSNHHAHSTRS